MVFAVVWIQLLLWTKQVLPLEMNARVATEQILAEACQQMSLPAQSRLLDSAMLQLKKIEKAGGWGKVSHWLRRVQKGDSGSSVIQIRKCLSEQGYPNDIANTVFDETLERLVKHYQFHHGLTADGIIGKASIRELNTPVSERINMILANLTATNSWKNRIDQRSIVINIPAFMLYANDSSGHGFSCKVVVGKLADPTAVFSAQMEELVFNPYWDIPNSILQKEILPEIRRDPFFLERNHMEWLGVRLRQKPGDDNALGRIKFIFPNPYHMYLHDTPAKQLFERESRAFSHGCIRVAEPHQLAFFCLQGTEWGNIDRIHQLTGSGKEKRIVIKDKIPVNIVYLTAFVDQSGHLNFRHDLYKKRQKDLKTPKKE